MESDFIILAPSYRRAKGCFTQKYLSECLYVVAESEAADYEAEGHRILVAPDSAQGNLCRIRNWILDNSPKKNLLLLDDDISSFCRYERNVSRDMTESEFYEFVENAFIMAQEAGARFWGVNCVDDKGSYREATPFSFNAYIGGPCQAHILEHGIRYDESLPLKEDFDMTLQQLNKYRRVMRFNFVHYFAKMHKNVGGCATYRTLEKEKQNLEALRKKWGSKIIKTDSGASQVKRKSENLYDINPIMRSPIKGV